MTALDMLLFLFVGAAISGAIGAAIGGTKYKRRGGAGFLLGFFLGPIGWIIAALLPSTPQAEAARRAEVDIEVRKLGGASQVVHAKVAEGTMEFCPSCGNIIGSDLRACQYCSAPLHRNCPWCSEWIKASAVVCKHCGKDVDPVSI